MYIFTSIPHTWSDNGVMISLGGLNMSYSYGQLMSPLTMNFLSILVEKPEWHGARHEGGKLGIVVVSGGENGKENIASIGLMSPNKFKCLMPAGN